MKSANDRRRRLLGEETVLIFILGKYRTRILIFRVQTINKIKNINNRVKLLMHLT